MIGCPCLRLLPYITPWSKLSGICVGLRNYNVLNYRRKEFGSKLVMSSAHVRLLSPKDLGLVFDGSCLKSFLSSTVTSFHHSCCKFMIFCFRSTAELLIWLFASSFEGFCSWIPVFWWNNSWKILTANVFHVGQKVRNIASETAIHK